MPPLRGPRLRGTTGARRVCVRHAPRTPAASRANCARHANHAEAAHSSDRRRFLCARAASGVPPRRRAHAPAPKSPPIAPRPRSPPLTIVGALVAVAVAAFFVQEAVFAVHKRRLSHIPGPRGFPVVGHIPYLLSEPWMRFAAFSTQYGPCYKLWIWHKLFVVIADPVLVKRVFFDKRAIYPKDTWSYKFFECVAASGERASSEAVCVCRGGLHAVDGVCDGGTAWAVDQDHAAGAAAA